jgi:hypothetical protein
MSDRDPEDRGNTREAHESAIAKLSETLARMDRLDATGTLPPRADVLYLTAQLIRHRISLALLAARTGTASTVL